MVDDTKSEMAQPNQVSRTHRTTDIEMLVNLAGSYNGGLPNQASEEEKWLHLYLRTVGSGEDDDRDDKKVGTLEGYPFTTYASIFKAAYCDEKYQERIWIIRALHTMAALGDPGAQTELGNLYEDRNGRSLLLQNEEIAFQLYQLAANQGDTEGQYLVAECYLHGRGI